MEDSSVLLALQLQLDDLDTLPLPNDNNGSATTANEYAAFTALRAEVHDLQQHYLDLQLARSLRTIDRIRTTRSPSTRVRNSSTNRRNAEPGTPSDTLQVPHSTRRPTSTTGGGIANTTTAAHTQAGEVMNHEFSRDIARSPEPDAVSTVPATKDRKELEGGEAFLDSRHQSSKQGTSSNTASDPVAAETERPSVVHTLTSNGEEPVITEKPSLATSSTVTISNSTERKPTELKLIAHERPKSSVVTSKKVTDDVSKRDRPNSQATESTGQTAPSTRSQPITCIEPLPSEPSLPKADSLKSAMLQPDSLDQFPERPHSSLTSAPTPQSPNVPLADLEEIHDCTACDEKVANNVAHHATCEHYFCRPCAVYMFKMALANESVFPPRCCELPLDATEEILGKELYEKVKAKVFELSLEDPTYCADPLCGRLIPPNAIAADVATCICSHRTCSLCKGNVHPDQVCPEDPQIQTVLDLSKSKGWKQCAQCNHMIEISMGCNHMK